MPRRYPPETRRQVIELGSVRDGSKRRELDGFEVSTAAGCAERRPYDLGYPAHRARESVNKRTGRSALAGGPLQRVIALLRPCRENRV